MCRRLIFLVSLVLVLALVGNASADLVAYWTFDTDYTSVTHAGSGKFTGVPTGNVSIGTGAGEYKIGTGALKIDDDLTTTTPANYLKVTADNVLSWTSPMSVSVVAWFKYSDIGNDGSNVRNFIYESADAATELEYSVSFGIRDDTDATIGGVPIKVTQYYYQTDTTNSINSGYHPTNSGYSGQVDDDEWHLSVMIWNRSAMAGDGRIKFWLDGVKIVDQSPIRDVPFATKPDVLDDLRTPQEIFMFGESPHDLGNRSFDGYIDDVAIFNHALLAADVAYLWNGGAGNPVPEPATIALLGMGGLMLLRRKRSRA